MKDEDVFNLISQVESHECLWDPNCTAFHSKVQMDHAWADIADKLNMDAKDVAHKWNNLRNQYRCNSKGFKTGPGAGITPKWKLFKAMSFFGHADEQQKLSKTSNILNEEIITAPAVVDSSNFSNSTAPTSSQCSANPSRLLQFLMMIVSPFTK